MVGIKSEAVATISNEDNDSRLIFLNKTVRDESVEIIIDQIIKWNEEDDKKDAKEKNFVRKPIKFIVNTYGGVVYDGFALISVMEQSKTPIYTYVYGKTMSMGLPIALAGHKRFASKWASFMYHEIATGAWGKLEELKQEVGECERLQKMYDTYILSKCNLRESDLLAVRNKRADWFFGAEEALKLGIIDEII
jgi:ATP-dependent Clp protease protease subunit